MGCKSDPSESPFKYLQNEDEDENRNPSVQNRTTKVGESLDSKPQSAKPTEKSDHKWKIIWPLVFLIGYIHIEAIIGFVLGVTHAKIGTLVWFFILVQFGATGIICGAHRLWTHRAYKAGVTFRIFLMFCNTLALQVWAILEIFHYCAKLHGNS